MIAAARSPRRRREATVGADDLGRYLRALAGPQPSGLLELRARRPDGMSQRFYGADELDRAAGAIRALGARTDVYVGVLLRDRRGGGRDAIDGGRVVFVELDSHAAATLLERAPAPPSMLVASGTPGHLHAYWLLRERVSAARVEAANRRMCAHLGGDKASVDRARILRPPETVNHKHRPPRPVQLLACDPDCVYELDALTRGLADPTPPRTPTPPAALDVRRRSDPAGDLLHAQLRQISTADYVRSLTGREPDRAGKIHCPLHADDRTPSLQCYGDGTFCCFGCRRGGTIFDFAAALWRMPTKGHGFLRLRSRLGDHFGLATAVAPAAPDGSAPAHLRRRAPAHDQEVQR